MKFKFRSLVNQHHKRVYSLALHMLGNRAEAEDVTQETFERLWRNVNKVETEQAQAWLLAVARNRCIDQLRARHVCDPLDEELECPLLQNTPDRQTEQAQLSYWVRNGISKLKEPYRSLITLADCQQKSVREVAGVLALSENQVKVYLHRARRQLRAFLQGMAL